MARDDSDLKTAGEVVAWYRERLPGEARTHGEPNPMFNAERLRILDLFVAALGNRRLAKCRAHHLLDFINDQPGIKSPWTRRRWLSTLMRPFNLATKLGAIGRNPFGGVELPQGENRRDFTGDEFRTLLRHSPPPLRRVLIFLRLTGARPGEMWSTKVSDVKLAEARIVLAQHKTRKATRRPRCIYLNSVALKLVRWLIPQADEAGYLFLNGCGRPWSCSALTKAVRTARRRAGLPDDVSAYLCRHTFATGAIINGENPAIVAELLGHSGTQTIGRYLHLTDKREHLIEAVERAARVPLMGKGRAG